MKLNFKKIPVVFLALATLGTSLGANPARAEGAAGSAYVMWCFAGATAYFVGSSAVTAKTGRQVSTAEHAAGYAASCAAADGALYSLAHQSEDVPTEKEMAQEEEQGE